MIIVKRKQGESTTLLLHRFSKRVKQSGVLREAKKRRYRSRPVTKAKRKASALYRDKKRREFEAAKKLGNDFKG